MGKQRFTGDLKDNNTRVDDVDININGDVVLLFGKINPEEWKAGVHNDDMTVIREEEGRLVG